MGQSVACEAGSTISPEVVFVCYLTSESAATQATNSLKKEFCSIMSNFKS